MGLTASSSGIDTIKQDVFEKAIGLNYTIAFAGNPNVGKTSIFNNLTGLHQHTGNWPGKTVSNAYGICEYKDKKLLLVDLPGTYSLMSNSQEEEIARDYICFGGSDLCVIVVDATCLERNLNLVLQILEMTPHVIVCVNLLDEAKKKSINVNLDALSKILGVPVVGTVANKPKTLKKLLDTMYNYLENPNKNSHRYLVKYDDVIENTISNIIDDISLLLPDNKKCLARWIAIKLFFGNTDISNILKANLNIDSSKLDVIIEKLSNLKSDLEDKAPLDNLYDNIVIKIVQSAEEIRKQVVEFKEAKYNLRDRKIDKILTSKKFGIPIMLVFLAVIFWITIVGANYPSQLLSSFFGMLQENLLILFKFLHIPEFVTNLLIYGMYQTVTWVISVMLPPMAIFFPMFTLLEDLGYLPRIAFNLDNYFKKTCSTGKQALTMCMGFGCNAAGVVGTRIIDSTREKIISIVTNNFVPCNRPFSFSYYYCNDFHWLLLFWFPCKHYSYSYCNFDYITWNILNSYDFKIAF